MLKYTFIKGYETFAFISSSYTCLPRTLVSLLKRKVAISSNTTFLFVQLNRILTQKGMLAWCLVAVAILFFWHTLLWMIDESLVAQYRIYPRGPFLPCSTIWQSTSSGNVVWPVWHCTSIPPGIFFPNYRHFFQNRPRLGSFSLISGHLNYLKEQLTGITFKETDGKMASLDITIDWWTKIKWLFQSIKQNLLLKLQPCKGDSYLSFP